MSLLDEETSSSDTLNSDTEATDPKWGITDRIDRLLSVDLPRRGRIDLLYPHFREYYGAPLSLLAARALERNVSQGDLVLIATGWLNRPSVCAAVAESDGPTGAAAMARAVSIGLGAVPVILVEAELVTAMKAVIHAAGLRTLSLEEAIKTGNPDVLLHGAAVLAYPTDRAAAAEMARQLMEHSVGAFIAIEKGGANEHGRVHMSQGRECTGTVASMDSLIESCKERSIPTIGIGDGGNEIGMGNDGGALIDVLPYGRDCGCGCGGGIVPFTETDVVFPATVSNWGGYGICAALAAVLNDPRVMHDEALESRMLAACSAHGLIDGVTGFTDPTSDGLDESIHLGVVTLLRTLIGCGIDRRAWPS